jgi:hypothetical protein
LAALAVLFLGGAAEAFQPVADVGDLVIPLPAERAIPQWRTMDAASSPNPAAVAFETRVGGSWRFWWNEATGTAHQAWGTGYQAATGLVTDAAEAERIAREWIRANADLLGTSGEDLETVSVAHGLGKWGIVFRQVYEGLPVLGGRAHVVMTETGRIYNFGSDAYPGIDISTEPVLTKEEALGIAQRSVGFVAGRDEVRLEGELVVIPDPTGGVVTHHLAYRNQVRVEDPLGVWTTYVDAHTGDILGRWNEIQFVDFQGNSRGDIEDFSYCDGSFQRPVANQNISISGVGSTTTDANGDFTVPYGGTDPKTISAEFLGPYLNVNNQAGPDASFTGTITPGQFFQIDWNDGNSQVDERDVWLHANRIHDWLKEIDPGMTQADYSMLARVSINDACNAYWDGYSINFYRQNGGCANTGRLGDVIYHEYGHGITQWIYGTNSCDTGEANSDVVAMLLDGNSIIAEGFFLNNCTSGIRNCANNMQYPDDYVPGQCHNNGQIICGFWWDARQELLVSYSEQEAVDILRNDWHWSRKLAHPQSYPDQVLEAFVADDDDGNLDNGTPHHAELCVGATNHGFDCPEILEGVIIVHTPLESTTEEGVPFDVQAVIYSTFTDIDPDNTFLYYRVNGGDFVQVPMTPTGEPDTWHAEIPGQTQPTEIDYYIYGQDLDGNFRTSPANAPDATYSFDVALVWEKFETSDAGWTVGDVDDDATTGIWVRVDPVGTIAQPEDDHSIEGTMCWVTGQHQPGQGDGYNDVDDGKTTLFSAVYDLTGATYAVVKYWRWYSNDRGNAPGQDVWLVQARNNNGPWVDLENTMLSSNAWVQIEADLLALLGAPLGQVQFKFVASDEGTGSLVEAGVDDFELLATLESSDVGESAGRLAYRLWPARPNPVNPRTILRFSVPERVTARLAIYGVDGRLVRTLVDGPVAPGEHTLAWDGRDGAGQPVASGVYYYRLEAGSFRATRQMVVLK